MKLYIGNKNYSSWSLRPWLLMKTFGIAFEEAFIPLYGEGSVARLAAISPSAKVPCLHDSEAVVWDSLAIVEYLAERHAGLWPGEALARAWARSAAAEMHSGFPNLRNDLSMNIRLRRAHRGGATTLAEIARIVELWRDGRERFGTGGDFLCGAFSAVDAFYAPVALRFESYGVVLGPVQRAYCDALLALPAMQAWIADARAEKERIPSLEPSDA